MAAVKVTDPADAKFDTDLTVDDVKAMHEFDFVRFTVADLHGIGRCRVVPRRHFQHFAKRGVDLFSGMLALGPRGDLRPLDEVHAANYGNAIVRPMTQTLRALPWAAERRFKVGELLCETFWNKSHLGGARQEACPRYVARRQLQQLDQLGYTLLSAYEVEFKAYKRGTTTPVFDGNDTLSTLVLSEFEAYIYGLDADLKDAGVDVGAFQIESSQGQFEFATNTSHGIEAADMVFRLKQGVKEISIQKGMEATFMSKSDTDPIGNGLHFNHSLWSKETKENAFSDSECPDGLSLLARQWLAGLMRHAKGLTALCSPTVNCYRRLSKLFTPDRSNWGIDNRLTAYRVKNNSPQETYVENRIPSGSTNPYVVMAATVAAGISGIRERLECPPQRVGDEELLPKTLGDALDALEQDKVLVDALGEEFIKWFVKIKREMEIDELKNDSLEQELKLYFKMF